MRHFDYSISNPPYQRDAKKSKNNTAYSIYHVFYKNSVDMSINTAMIFPRW